MKDIQDINSSTTPDTTPYTTPDTTSPTKEKEFVNGLIVKKPRDTAPEWIKCNLSIKREDLLQWLGQKEGDWVNVQVCEARSGKWYAEVDNWQPTKKASSDNGPRGF